MLNRRDRIESPAGLFKFSTFFFSQLPQFASVKNVIDSLYLGDKLNRPEQRKNFHSLLINFGEIGIFIRETEKTQH